MRFKLDSEPILFKGSGERRFTIAKGEDNLYFVGYDPITLLACGIQLAPRANEGKWKRSLYPYYRAWLAHVRSTGEVVPTLIKVG